MTNTATNGLFSRGVILPDLFLGVVSSVSPQIVGVNLSEAGRPSGSFAYGGRYGRGEVSELVLIEGQQNLLLGRIANVRLRENERRSINRDFAGSNELPALGEIQLLATVAMDDLSVMPGVDAYPRLGDRIYTAPNEFIQQLPQLVDNDGAPEDGVLINIGTIGVGGGQVRVKPERLFGRHCAILGATGGGKSWTTARIIEECMGGRAKLVLLDATGEYRGFNGPRVRHCHLGTDLNPPSESDDTALPATSFQESDFIALFEPAGRTQGPIFRAAIRSLRLAQLRTDLAPNGFIEKIDQTKTQYENALVDAETSQKLDDPRQPFDARYLVQQIEQECVYPTPYGSSNSTKWGGRNDSNFSYCLTLIARINDVLNSPAFSCIFDVDEKFSLTSIIDEFKDDDYNLLRISLSGVPYEYNAREIVANALGRHILKEARTGAYHNHPILVVVDEAHSFLGRQIGGEDFAFRLDAFELIAKEGRKYGVNICLISQRPRDVTEGVLSQVGTIIVHRMTNDHDRSLVERACGEIDRSAVDLLPNLKQGEAAIIGVDFPIPVTVRVNPPVARPFSGGPNYQTDWLKSST